jgi:hypothetical protein
MELVGMAERDEMLQTEGMTEHLNPAVNEAADEQFSPLRLNEDARSHRPMTPLGYALQVQLRDGPLNIENADDALRAVDAITIAREARLAPEYAARPP